jgi:hypothetical protein
MRMKTNYLIKLSFRYTSILKDSLQLRVERILRNPLQLRVR